MYSCWDIVNRKSSLRLFHPYFAIISIPKKVYPAAGYASEVYEHGGTVAVFNLEKTDGDADAGFIFYGPCETELIRVLGVQPE